MFTFVMKMEINYCLKCRYLQFYSSFIRPFKHSLYLKQIVRRKDTTMLWSGVEKDDSLVHT